MTSSQIVSSLLVVLLGVAVTSSQSTGVDLTLVGGSTGTAVVLAVIDRIRDRCIFSEDRLFLRRMAYVVSLDGTSSSITYDDGGIWQIKESQFQATQNCGSALLSSACQTIQSELGIDWTTVTWTDLRKPMYSGLAAALLTLYLLNGNDMSGDITSQSQLWASDFDGNAQDYVTLATNATAIECGDKMDLVFILDSSFSLDTASFTLMRSFAADVVEVMEVDSGKVRVADIVYGSHVQVVFTLDAYTTETDVRNALQNTVKLGGGTLTHDALDQAAVTLYDTSSGARSDAKKVAILITDGLSFNPTSTASSAIALKDKGTTVFAVGIGSYDRDELNAVATSPNCSHVFTLTDFSAILSILTQIQISTCSASMVLTPGGTVSGEISETPVEVTTRTLNPGPNSTITVNVTCGNLQIYLSYSERNPSPVVYEETHNATHLDAAIIITPAALAQGSPIYLSIYGTRLSTSQAAQLNCSEYEWMISVAEPSVKVRLVGGQSDSQGRVEVFTNGTWGTVCDDSFGEDDAIVVCRMLGYEGLMPVVHAGSYFGVGEGTIWLDGLNCTGGESSILQCVHDGEGVHDCTHNEDVGVDCAHANASTVTFVRLTGGSSSSEGRLEVNVSGTWGTVCSNDFDVTDASVVCKILGYTGKTPEVKEGAAYGQGTSPVWLDGVQCDGTEFSIFMCPNNGIGVANCSQSDEVGIDCDPQTTTSLPSTDSGGTDLIPIIAGAAGGALLLTALAVGGVLLKKYLAGGAAVKAAGLKDSSSSESSTPFDSSMSLGSADTIPGIETPLPIRMPTDTHLPPLRNNTPLFPALRS